MTDDKKRNPVDQTPEPDEQQKGGEATATDQEMTDLEEDTTMEEGTTTEPDDEGH